MVTELRNEPPIDPNMPILVAGDPEKIIIKTTKGWNSIEPGVINEINDLISMQGLP